MATQWMAGAGSAVRRWLRQWLHARLQLAFLFCAGSGCRRVVVAHRALRKDGIFLYGEWLCSPRCFEAALLRALLQGSPGERHAMPRLPRMPFRLLLLQQGLVTEADLRAAQLQARQQGVPLSQALLALGMVSEEQLAAALAAENGCAFYTLVPASVAPAWRLPRTLAEQYCAVTVHAGDERLVIGFVHRVERTVLAVMEQVTGRKAAPCIVTATRHRQELQRQRDPSSGALASTRETLSLPGRASQKTHAMTRPEAARKLVRLAMEAGAEQTRLGRIGHVVWMRCWSNDVCCEDHLIEIAEDTSAFSAAEDSHRFVRL